MVLRLIYFAWVNILGAWVSAYGFGIPGPFEEFKMNMDPQVLTLNSNLPTSIVAEKNLYFLLSHKGTEGSYTHKHKYRVSQWQTLIVPIAWTQEGEINHFPNMLCSSVSDKHKI